MEYELDLILIMENKTENLITHNKQIYWNNEIKWTYI